MRKIVKGVFFGAIVLGGILGCVISMLQHQKSHLTHSSHDLYVSPF